MYLHLGNDVVIPTDEIIGIFDLDKSTVKKVTRDYLRISEQNGEVINVSSELPKSFVVCENNKKNLVYINQISSATLLKRMESLNNLCDLKRVEKE